MAVQTQNFAAAIGKFAQETEDKITAVFRDASEEVIELMRSYTPVDFGFLAGTIQASLSAPVPINPSATGGNMSISPDASVGQVSLVVNDAKLGDTIYGSFTMAYAGYVEYGTSKMAPRGMVRRAAAQWQTIVNQSIGKARSATSRGRSQRR